MIFRLKQGWKNSTKLRRKTFLCNHADTFSTTLTSEHNTLEMFVARMVAARVIRRVGAGEGLARRHPGATLAWVPHSASVSTTGSCASTVVKAMCFARVVVATRPEI